MMKQRLLVLVVAAALLSSQPAQAGVTKSVKDFGATADGKTDDAPAIAAAIRALPAEGGTVSIPEGTYAIGGSGILLNRSNVELTGAGPQKTVLVHIGKPGPLVQSAASDRVQKNISLKNLCFDWQAGNSGAATAACISLYGAHAGSLLISGCRFWRSPAQCIALSGVDGAVIEDCLFESAGDAQSTGVYMLRSPKNIVIRRNSFRWLENGVLVHTGDTAHPDQAPAENIEISENRFQFGWWLIREVTVGEGSNVRYTANTLEDSKARFANLLGDAKQNVRVLPVKQSGRGTFSGTRLTDPSAHFLARKVRRGDIVRAGSAFAAVKAASSEGALDVEEWLGETDRLPLPPPAAGAAYTVYGVILGQIQSFAATSVTTTRWWDFDGKAVTPAPGTRYEILGRRPNYPVHAEAGVRAITVRDNAFSRGWCDQISVYGNKAVITGNIIEDGEDMGITLHGKEHQVTGNRIAHQGAGGIWAGCDDSIIQRNTIVDTQWVNFQNDFALGDIMIEDGNRNNVIGNNCARAGNAMGLHGIVVFAGSKGSAGNVLRDNKCQGHVKAEIKLCGRGGTVSGTIIEGNQGQTVSEGATPGTKRKGGQ